MNPWQDLQTMFNLLSKGWDWVYYLIGPGFPIGFATFFMYMIIRVFHRVVINPYLGSLFYPGENPLSSPSVADDTGARSSYKAYGKARPSTLSSSAAMGKIRVDLK